jgi:hypothetical protein
VLAALIGATPLAREICEFSCAQHHTGSTTSEQAHHEHGSSMTDHEMSHHEMETSDAVESSFHASLSSGIHGCTHKVESQPVSITAKLEIGAPALAFHAVDPVPSLLAAHTFAVPLRVAGLTPIPIALRTPLRV